MIVIHIQFLIERSLLKQKKKTYKSTSTRYIWWDSEANQEPDNEETKHKELGLKVHKPNLVVLIETIINTTCFTT